MSKKLLNESTIRKFMRLANIDRLADGFINEASAGLADQGANKPPAASKAHPGPHKNTKAKGGDLASQGPGLVKEEELDEDEEVVEEGMYEEEHAGAEAPVGDVPLDLSGDEGPEEGGITETDIEDLVVAIADTIQRETGVLVDVTSDDEVSPEMDAPAPEGEEGGEELPAPEGDEDGDVLEGIDMFDEDAIVSETFRRVKRRLRGMQKEERLLESLTNKLYKRLARKSKK